MAVQYVQHEKIAADEMVDLLRFYYQSQRSRIVLPNGQNVRYKRSTIFTLSVWKGTSCQGCGLEANKFIMQHQGHVPCTRRGVCQRSNANLYWESDTGEQKMFTKDHIIPKSKGGLSAIWNYQLMCESCNMEKADTLPTDEQLSVINYYRSFHPRELENMIRAQIAEASTLIM